MYRECGRNLFIKVSRSITAVRRNHYALRGTYAFVQLSDLVALYFNAGS
jgi:hypothetical protein